jgi:hypothetical protein
MNIRSQFAWLAALVLLLATDSALADMPAPPLRRLDDLTRVKVLAAVAGLIILGFGMVLLAWLGARFAQHYRHGSSSFRPTRRPDENDWARTPLAPGDAQSASPPTTPEP